MPLGPYKLHARHFPFLTSLRLVLAPLGCCTCVHIVICLKNVALHLSPSLDCRLPATGPPPSAMLPGRTNWKSRLSLALQRCKACHTQQQLTSQQLGGSVQWRLPGWGWCPQGAFALSSPRLGCQRVAQAGRRQDPLAGFLALFMKGKVIFITFHLEGSYKGFIWCSLRSSCSALPRRKTSDWSLCFMPENLNE